MRLIDADVVIEKVMNYCKDDDGSCVEANADIRELLDEIENLPTIQPERAEGEWSDGYRWQRCSLCKQTGKKSWNYCPNCGAKMKGERQK